MLMKPVKDSITTWLAKEIKMDRIRIFFDGMPVFPFVARIICQPDRKNNNEPPEVWWYGTFVQPVEFA
jgi:hypothetical protein